MNRQKLLLLVLLAVVLAGCSSPETVVQEIEKFEKSVVPFEDIAFIKVDFFDSPIFGMLRILSIPALIGLAFVVVRSRATDPDFLSVVGVRFLILLLVGALSTAVIFLAFDSLGHVLWPDGLTFHYVRVSLGWTIPVLEGGVVPPALPDPFSWALALTTLTTIPPLHQFVEIGLVIGTLITIGFAAFSGDLSGVGRMILAWVAWVVFPLMWVLVINGSRDALRSGVSPSSVAFGFWLVSWAIFAILTVAPFFVAFPSASSSAPRPATPPATNTTTTAALAGVLGYTVGQAGRAGRAGGSPSQGSKAWPMGPSGSTGPRPAALPPPRPSSGGGGGNGPGGGGQVQAANSTAAYPSRGPRSASADTRPPSSATVSASGANPSRTLPHPRTSRGSDRTYDGRQPSVPTRGQSFRAGQSGRKPSYRAKDDLFDESGLTILVKGQVVAGEVKDGKIRYGEEWIPLGLFESEGESS